MKPEKGGSGFNPEAQSNPYAQIPDLVRRSILARPDRARIAQRDLLKQIAADPYFDPVLFAVAETQRILISAKDAKQIRTAKEFLGEIITQGTGKEDSPKTEFIFRVNGQVISTATDIINNDELIHKKNFLRHNLPPKYEGFISTIPRLKRDLEEESKHGTKEISILQTPQLSQAAIDKLQQELARHNQWKQSFEELVNTSDFIESTTISRDILIDLLKKEPEFSADIGRQKLYTQKRAELSLEDIEKMHYPLSGDEFYQLNNYLIAGLDDMESRNILPHHASAIRKLFFAPTNFRKDILYRNQNVLANINSWQELFTYCLFFEQDEKIETQTKKIVSSLPDYIPLYDLIAGYCLDPYLMDPNEDDTVGEMLNRHWLFSNAVGYYFEHHAEEDASALLYPHQEIAREYFKEVLLPQLKTRASKLGLEDRLGKEIKNLEEQDVASEQRLRTIKQVFEKNAGQEFLERLQTHSQETEDVTRNVWEDTFERRMHFLPMEEGENTVGFSEESIPNILGLRSITMRTVGSPQDWKIRVVFHPLNMPFDIPAFLTKDGRLDFRTPLEQKIPGLYTMLNHIAVLTFHDLVTQERKEREAGTREPKSERNGKRENGDKAKGDRPDRTYSRDLPRVQQDRKLIADVYEATNRTPRRVELHDRLLPGAREYEAAVEIYEEVKSRPNVDKDLMSWATEELEEARKSADRISEQKRLSIPAKFQFPTITDPLTGEERYLKTWVVEHTSPKPTPEELKSPVKLYERYYRNSSALASLDQMKPWFIGQ